MAEAYLLSRVKSMRSVRRGIAIVTTTAMLPFLTAARPIQRDDLEPEVHSLRASTLEVTYGGFTDLMGVAEYYGQLADKSFNKGDEARYRRLTNSSTRLYIQAAEEKVDEAVRAVNGGECEKGVDKANLAADIFLIAYYEDDQRDALLTSYLNTGYKYAFTLGGKKCGR